MKTVLGFQYCQAVLVAVALRKMHNNNKNRQADLNSSNYKRMTKLKVHFSLKAHFINAFLICSYAAEKNKKIFLKNLFISIANGTVLLSVQESVSVQSKKVCDGTPCKQPITATPAD